MNARQRVLKAMAGEEPDRVPWFDSIDDPIKMQLLGVKSVSDLDEAKAAEKLGNDILKVCGDEKRPFIGKYYFNTRMFEYCAPVFCDFNYVGGDAEGSDEQLSSFGAPHIKTEDDLTLMQFKDPNDDRYYDIVNRFMDRYGKTDYAIEACMAPGMMNIIYSMGIEGFSYALYDKPQMLEKMFDAYMEWNCIVARRLQGAGIDVLVLADDFCVTTGPLIPPQHWNEIFKPRLKKLFDAIDIPILWHTCSKVYLYLDDLIELGIAAFHPIDPTVPDYPLERVKKEFGDRLCLVGNVDMGLLTDGTPEAVFENTRECIRIGAPGGRYMLASANTLAYYIKVENLMAMAEALKRYGKYPKAGK